jgi:hypothetical protein
MRAAKIFFLLALACGAAHAQPVHFTVVQTCGTESYTVGDVRPGTMDQNGKICAYGVGGGGGGSNMATDGSNATSGALGNITGAASANAHYVIVGPTSGPAGTPTFRALISTDLPNLSSTYCPVSGGCASAGLATDGSNATSAALANIAGASSTSQNYVLAGPTSGSGAPTMRALTPGDVPSPADVALIATGSSTTRNATDRAAAVYNIRDYGAQGTGGTPATVGSLYPGATLDSLVATVVNGKTPFAQLNNPAVGLTFSMTTTASQGAPGTTLQFKNTFTFPSIWSATVAKWQQPTTGYFVLTTDNSGMGVTGTCIAANTKVTAVDRDPASGTYGQVTLNQNTTGGSGCASGTSITFKITSAQLTARTMDWLGLQAAYAAAWYQGAPGLTTAGTVGAEVYAPAGKYSINAVVVNPGNSNNGTGSNTGTVSLLLRGDGLRNTTFNWNSDLGADACGIIEGLRAGGNGNQQYLGFSMVGPGGALTYGTFPASMNGLCSGELTIRDSVDISGFHYGQATVLDHWKVYRSHSTLNGCGIAFAAYSQAYGNATIEDSPMDGNSVASICIAEGNAIDSSHFSNSDLGHGPFGVYEEPHLANFSGTPAFTGCITKSIWENMWVEFTGNEFINCHPTTTDGAIDNNVFIAGGDADINGGYATNWAAKPNAAVVDGYDYQGNTMLGTRWSFAYGGVTDAIVKCGSGSCTNNAFRGDTVQNLSSDATKPAFLGNASSGNSFYTTAGNGYWRQAYGSVGSNVPASINTFGYVTAYADGQGFAGVTASACGDGLACPVVRNDINVQLSKVDTSQVCNYGQPIAFSTAGATCVLDSRQAPVGKATFDNGASGVFVQIDTAVVEGNPGMQAGVTAAGSGGNTSCTALTNSFVEFTTVASGNCFDLPGDWPTGESITVFNRGGQTIAAHPAARADSTGVQIEGNGNGTSVNLTNGSDAVYVRRSTTQWRIQ